MNNFDLRLGDCLDLFKTMPDCSIDLIVSDPPYRTVPGGNTTKKNATSGILSGKSRSATSGKIFKENDISFSSWLPEIYRVLKQNTHCYIFINGRNLVELGTEAKKAGFVFQNLLVWNKGNVTPNRYYMQKCEFILMLRKGKAKNINNLGTSNLLEFPNIIGKKKHPTEKPVELLKVLIENSTVPGEIVFDPFMGCGSTGAAAYELKRSFVGFEIDEGYFKIAEQRISKEGC